MLAEAAVLAHPYDLDERLRLADAVEASEPEWAAFLRAGVRLARTDPDSDVGAQLERELRILYRRRVRELVYEPHAGWLQAPRLYGGHIEGGTVDTSEFLHNAESHFAELPLLHLGFTGAKTHLEALLSAQWLPRLRSLEIYDAALDDDDAARVAASPGLGGLRYLGLPLNQITVRGLEELAASPFMAAVQFIDLRHNPAPAVGRAPLQDCGAVFGYERNPFAEQLIARYGSRPWLNRCDPVAPDRTRL